MLPRHVNIAVGTAISVVSLPQISLFPKELTPSYNGSADYRAITDTTWTNNPRTTSQGLSSILNVTYVDLSTGYGVIAWAPLLSSTFALYEALGGSGPLANLARSSTSATLLSKAPYVAPICGDWYPGSVDAEDNFIEFKSSTGPFHTNTTYRQAIESLNVTDASVPGIFWLKPPERYREEFSVLAFLVLKSPVNSNIYYVNCTVKAAWLPSTITYSRSEPPVAYPELSSWQNASSWDEIVSIDPSWVELASAADTTSLFAFNWTTFQDLFGPSFTTGPGLIAGLIATSMATSVTDFFGNTTLTNFTVDMSWSGMGYAAQSAPVIIAMCILFIYCVFVLSFILYSIWSGVSSNSWDSISEITALALNSKSPNGHTSAGIETIGIFREPVAILANKDESLEIVFEDKRTLGEYAKIERNKKY
ncbi:hypothetical protein BU16DRAFT_576349 [Lophium mytilinum]|uniref:Uncharacterized protein n=1 Tax=Lophium mytilinum TaxID=390894 RepID=A0A6A6RF03_9PEZI|nr:hypothetical protein BU16DRAFT_576349 [Lophium mytilinum]